MRNTLAFTLEDQSAERDARLLARTDRRPRRPARFRCLPATPPIVAPAAVSGYRRLGKVLKPARKDFHARARRSKPPVVLQTSSITTNEDLSFQSHAPPASPREPDQRDQHGQSDCNWVRCQGVRARASAAHKMTVVADAQSPARAVSDRCQETCRPALPITVLHGTPPRQPAGRRHYGRESLHLELRSS